MNSFSENFAQLCEKEGIIYHDIKIYFTAFTHPSYANENHLPHNERLEFIGDAILDFLVGEYIYKTFPDMDEGEMTKLRAVYVCEEANKNYATKLGLDELILLGKGEDYQSGRTRPAVLADVFEAFLGAMYLDHGSMNQPKAILERIVFPDISSKVNYIKDYKSILQELMQSENRKSVTYILEKEDGPSHDKTFYVGVYFEKVKLGEGTGKSKKEAERLAAENALKKLAK